MQGVSGLGQIWQAARGMFGGREEVMPARADAPAAGGEAEIADLVAKRYAYSRQAKQPFLETWATCLAFLVGEQWRQWDREQRRLVRQNRIPSWRVLVVDNQIPGIIDMACAKLARSRQIPRAVPNTGEPEDLEATQAGSRALEHWWHSGNMETRELEANVHRLLFGAGFLHDFWDPAKEARVPVQQGYSVDPQTGEQRPMMGAERAAVGDVCVEVLSVFDIFPEPCERWDDVTWAVVARRKPLWWFEDTFAERGREVVADKGEESDVFSSLLPEGEFTGAVTGAAAPDRDGLATLKVYYEAKSRRYPKGRHAMVAGSTVLFYAEELPLPHGEIPLTCFGYRYVPKRLWPAGLIETLLGQQTELNRGQSIISEILRLHAFPKWIVDKASKVSAKAITSAPGEVIEGEFNGGRALPPTAVPGPAVQGYVIQYPEMQREAIRHLSGQRDMSPNGIPPGVTAASALGLIESQNNVRLSTPARLGKGALERLARHVLETIIERYREPRLIATLGRDKQRQVYSLMGADIGQRDVIVDLTEGAADTDDVRLTRLDFWLNHGLLDALASPIRPFMLQVIRDTGDQWLADAVEQAEPEMLQEMMAQQMMEVQQAEQQMHQKAALDQQGMSAKLEHEGRQKRLERGHQTRLAKLKAPVAGGKR